MTSTVFHVSYLEPCFLLSSHWFNFPLPVYAPLICISQCNLSLCLQLVLLVPINSCSLFILLFILLFYYFILLFIFILFIYLFILFIIILLLFIYFILVLFYFIFILFLFILIFYYFILFLLLFFYLSYFCFYISVAVCLLMFFHIKMNIYNYT